MSVAALNYADHRPRSEFGRTAHGGIVEIVDDPDTCAGSPNWWAQGYSAAVRPEWMCKAIMLVDDEPGAEDPEDVDTAKDALVAEEVVRLPAVAPALDLQEIVEYEPIPYPEAVMDPSDDVVVHAATPARGADSTRTSCRIERRIWRGRLPPNVPLRPNVRFPSSRGPFILIIE